MSTLDSLLDTVEEADEEEDVKRPSSIGPLAHGKNNNVDGDECQFMATDVTDRQKMIANVGSSFKRQGNHLKLDEYDYPKNIDPLTSVSAQNVVKKKSKLFSELIPSKNKGSLDDSILKQDPLRPSKVLSTSNGKSRRNIFAKKTAQPKLAIPIKPPLEKPEIRAQDQDTTRATYRRYRVGESVLVCCPQSGSSNLVNRYGYPLGGGYTVEEQKGPYIYVFAIVKKVHFEEDAEYYTVTRADTGGDQRADAECMEPFATARGEAAALQAATESQLVENTRGLGGVSTPEGIMSSKKPKSRYFLDICRKLFSNLLSPLSWILHCIFHVIGKRISIFYSLARIVIRRHGKLLLNGMKPYSCVISITMVNVLVLCSMWYMFIDQARLVFLSPNTDYAFALVSQMIWLCLVLELLFEVFIRPEGYRNLLLSDKAFSPSTIRYINSFHLLIEFFSLITFIPEFICLWTNKYSCGDRLPFSFVNAVYVSVLGPSRLDAFYGRAILALTRLRVFGLVRHWKNMWIANSLSSGRWKFSRACLSGFVPSRVAPISSHNAKSDTATTEQSGTSLTNASNIGTALMVTNSHRALTILCTITGLFPLFSIIQANGGTNRVSTEMTKQLQAINLEFSNATDEEECNYFLESLYSWVIGVTRGPNSNLYRGPDAYLLHSFVEPLRCNNSRSLYDGFVGNSLCRNWSSTLKNSEELPEEVKSICTVWNMTTINSTSSFLAKNLDIRTGSVGVYSESSEGFLITENGNISTTFRVVATFNESNAVSLGSLSSFFLQLFLLVSILGGLSVVRRDSGVLVLGPLRRMLKIVARYAKNPLSTVRTGRRDDDSDDDEGSDSGERGSLEDKLGSYETEQLISAVSKITDLLRKCWGVAGADIISTNLATQEGTLTEVFNPTVPGKSVYALFAFAAINDFDHTLRQLGGEVMILINDVAAVLHGEVFRWGFGDSGQCNKNLGSAFLMVFRIGLVKEVIQKLEEATDVVFSNNNSKNPGMRKRIKNSGKALSGDSSQSTLTNSGTGERRRKSHRSSNSNRAAMSLSLQSLPGISTFTDRAVIGMLKSYAGIYRDNKLLAWKHDFRLGAGVGAFSVNMIFGMDAGWAVEGAVGSEYKIDATYLSPHVNMASRMMSACKQYGVSILLSQAVQELMSETARSKLRHLDTVTVKGSSLKQKIFTYDARHKGVDFFLFSRSDEQADFDSDRYSPNIWVTDQDLRAMRQHVTEDFEEAFNKGRDAYIAGDWKKAMLHLNNANEIMVENVMEQGYIQDELNELQNRILDGEDARAAEEDLRNDTGDGPSRRLIAYIESEGGVAPEGWKGYHPLTSK